MGILYCVFSFEVWLHHGTSMHNFMNDCQHGIHSKLHFVVNNCMHAFC